jgi:hypothetical protein
MGKLPHSILLVAAAAASMSAHAGAITGSASLTGLSYHLVDLDPNDGIAPWITFDGSGYVGAGSAIITVDALNNQVTNADPHISSGSIFSSTASSYQSPNGAVSFTYGPTGASSAVDISGASLGQLNGAAQPLYTVSGLAGTDYGSQYLPDFGASVPMSGDFSFTLSPNTALVIDGQVQASISVDLAQIPQGSSMQQDIQAGLYTAHAMGIIGAGAGFVSANYEILSSQVTMLMVGQDLDASGVQWSGLPSSDSSALTPFELTFTNDGIDAKKGGFVAGAGAMGGVSFEAVPVPEPGTWALMGLGLAGLMAISRQRRLGAKTYP